MNGKEPRLSQKGLQVLKIFLSQHGELIAGVDIMQSINISSGTLYPLLSRLTVCGWFICRAEKGCPKKLGRPLRKFYKLTAKGRTKSIQAIEEITYV